MKRVLLTGVGGFIGSHCLEYFLDNTDWYIIGLDSYRHKGTYSRLSEVSNFDSNRVLLLRHDLSVPLDSQLENRIMNRRIDERGNIVESRLDYIINMASDSAVERSVSDPGWCWRNNCELAYNMLEFARKVKPKIFVQVSTDEVYGDCPPGYAHKEWDTIVPSNPYCLMPDSKIISALGMIRIADFDPLYHSLVSNNRQSINKGYAIKKFCRHYKGKMLRIETEHGDVSCTPEHRFFRKETRFSRPINPDLYTWKGKPVLRRPHKKVAEVKAGEIAVGDYLMMSRYIPCPVETHPVDPVFARFLGYFIGDGSYSEKSGYVRLADQKRQYLAEYRDMLCRLLGVSKKSNTGEFGTLYDHGSKDCGYLQFASEELRHRVDLSSPKWKLAEYLFTANREAISSFLAGFMDAEATFCYEDNKLTRVELPQADIAVLENIQYLLHKLGIVGKIYPNEKLVITDNLSLQLIVGQIPTFKVKPGTMFAKMQHKGWSKNVLWSRVSKITEFEYDGPVYDLEVPDRHNYVANYFVVHNSASKAAQEALAISYWRTFDVPVVITNTMNTIGTWQDREKFLPKLIWKIATGQEMEIYADPQQDGSYHIGSRFYTHAENHADALVFIANKVPAMYKNGDQKPDRYNVVGEVELNNLEMAQLIAEIMGKELKYKLVPSESARRGYDRRYALDGSLLLQKGWRPPVEFKEGLKRIVDWTMQHPWWIV